MRQRSNAADKSGFLVVEDDAVVARSILRLLRPLTTAHAAANRANAMEAVDAKVWTALIVDEHLPDGSGLDVLQRFKERAPSSPALVLTGSEEPEVANRSFLLGASYARKPVCAEVVFAFAKAALEREEGARERRRLVLHDWQRTYQLTSSETTMLRLAVEGASRADLPGVTDTTLRTVDTHITNLLRKTGDASLQLAVSRLLRSIC